MNQKTGATDNGATAGLSPELIKKLPLKQRLAITSRQRLADLRAQRPAVTFTMEDQGLEADLTDVLKGAGFEVQSRRSVQALNLSQFLIHWMKKGHLVLIHYQPKVSSFNLIELLRELKRRDAYLTAEALIPVFSAAPGAAKQMEIFRVLGQFGVRYTIFMTPQAAEGKNLDEIVAGLIGYNDALKETFYADAPPPPVATDDAPKIAGVETYRKLLAGADDLIHENRLEEAIEELSKALKMAPDFDAMVKRGDAYYKSQQFVHALNDYREAHHLKGTAPDPYAKIGSCCFALVKQAARKEGPEKARKWAEMGLKNLATAEAMIENLEKDYLRHPENVVRPPFEPLIAALTEADFRGLGIDDLADQISDKARQMLVKTGADAFYNQETGVDARIDRAVLLARNGNYEEAERIFREIIDEAPEMVGPAFNNYAVELRKNGQFKKAFEIYMELLRFDIPDRPIVLENLKTAGFRYASALRADLRFSEATDVYKNLLTFMQKSDGKEWILCELAMTYLEMQDQASASFRLMEAIYLNPNLMNKRQFEAYEDLRSLRVEMIKKLQKGAL
jgi:tetratricopeptide (TPR) repeat protein